MAIPKPLKLKDLTELTREWDIHSTSYKRFTLIVNFVNGKLFTKYAVYHHERCIGVWTNAKVAFNKYEPLYDMSRPK